MTTAPKRASAWFHGCIDAAHNKTGEGGNRDAHGPFAYPQTMIIWSVRPRRFDLEVMQQDYPPNYSTLLVGPKQPCLVR